MEEEEDSSDARIGLVCGMVWAAWSGVQGVIEGVREGNKERPRDRAL